MAAGPASAASPAIAPGKVLLSAGAGSGVTGYQVTGTMTTMVRWTTSLQHLSITYTGSTVAKPAGSANDVRIYMNWQFTGPITGLTVTRWPKVPGSSHYVTGSGGQWTAVIVKECGAASGAGRCAIKFGTANVMRVTVVGGAPTAVEAVQASTAAWPGQSLHASPESSHTLP
jgi:hypothetical protein